MQLDQLSREREAEPRAFLLPGTGLRLLKLLEDAGLVLRSDADALAVKPTVANSASG